MSRSADRDELVVGGEPRVDLLPTEVRKRRKDKATRRALGWGVIGTVALVVAATLASTVGAIIGQSQLLDAQGRTADLLSEQAKYAIVRQVQAQVDTATAAREVGGSTDIDWKGYLQNIRAIIPADVAIDSVSVETASPFTAYAEPTAPLQEPRLGTLTLSLTSPDLPSVPAWLEAMKEMPGYADGSPGSITRSDTGAYNVGLTIHVNGGALSNRFASAETVEAK